jgi:hypothetical protein
MNAPATPTAPDKVRLSKPDSIAKQRNIKKMEDGIPKEDINQLVQSID